MGTAYVLRFSTGDTFELKKVKIKNDEIDKKKEGVWNLKNIKPIFIEKMEGLPFLKSKKQYPCYVIRTDQDKGFGVKWGDNDKEYKYMSPVQYSEMSRSQSLMALAQLKMKLPMFDFMMYIIVGLIIGYLLGTVFPATEFIGFAGGG